MRTITISEYIEAFMIWAGVARIDADDSKVLFDGYAFLRTHFPDDVKRAVNDYCVVAVPWLREHQGEDSRLDLRIAKSCLLDRLLYDGEKLRTIPCPRHKGKWSGCVVERCAHNCNHGACLTGWVANKEA